MGEGGSEGLIGGIPSRVEPCTNTIYPPEERKPSPISILSQFVVSGASLYVV